jgi:hypothetical protein
VRIKRFTQAEVVGIARNSTVFISPQDLAQMAEWDNFFKYLEYKCHKTWLHNVYFKRFERNEESGDKDK